ncbi:MAG: ThiF family adenylyltransferase [Rhodothermaceae bacterium]|nr:ThiF family adenylyltransferase [Rhodothermaceae bacterium]MYG68682.1 ThiF family adenylyltransferase [Rhodothermaceae bacterium]
MPPISQHARPSVVLRLTGYQHDALNSHLFPGDHCEAVAVALCGRRKGNDNTGRWGRREILTIHEIFPVPHRACHLRKPNCVSWPTEPILPLLRKAAEHDLAVLKIHSHPTGYAAFSERDDAADIDLFPSIMGWVDDSGPHASAIMLPQGKIIARAVYDDGKGDALFVPVDAVMVAGDCIRIWRKNECNPKAASLAVPEFAKRHAQAFGEGTTMVLRHLSVAIVGVSGTGSPVAEMLTRLGVGELILVDPKLVEDKNLNRILNATKKDIGRPKVNVLAKVLQHVGLGTHVIPLASDLFDPEVIRRVALADIIFGCVDSVDGRDLMNRLAAYYNLPYFDLGVRLDADGKGSVEAINGTVHYLQPDGSSLLSRKVYTLEDLSAAAIRRSDPAAYEQLQGENYLRGVREDRPAVISVNTLVASMAVNELLARIHPFRDYPNRQFATYRVNLNQARLMRDSETDACPILAPKVGRGDTSPLLDMPALSRQLAHQMAPAS